VKGVRSGARFGRCRHTGSGDAERAAITARVPTRRVIGHIGLPTTPDRTKIRDLILAHQRRRAPVRDRHGLPERWHARGAGTAREAAHSSRGIVARIDRRRHAGSEPACGGPACPVARRCDSK
jgi:hypothetical protein